MREDATPANREKASSANSVDAVDPHFCYGILQLLSSRGSRSPRSDGFDHCSPHRVVVIAEHAFSLFAGVASSLVAVARLPPRRREWLFLFSPSFLNLLLYLIMSTLYFLGKMELERERCLLVETLRSKLEDTRQKMVVFDNEVRQLKTELHEEKLTTANQTKEAREEAWDKVSILKLEINATMQDLDFERRRLKGAKERLMLWEIQLHAFYSTTEEMQVLFAKQQEQLKAMQRTLENEENYENTSVDMDGVIGGTPGRERRVRIL
ncbi:hypothetical protein HN51_039468 [Arachis hypogaea]